MKDKLDFFQELIENVKDIVFVLDFEKGLQYTNSAVQEILGYSPEEYYNDPGLIFKTIHPEDADKLVNFRGEKLEDKELRIMLRWIAKDGRIVFLENHAFFLTDNQERVIGLRGICRDVTGKIKAEEQHKAIFENTIVGIAVLKGMEIHLVNKRCCEILGYNSPQEVQGKVKVADLFPEGTREMVMDRYQRRLAGEQVPKTYETKVVRTDGKIIDVKLSASILDIDGGSYLHIMFEDITLEKQLIQSEKCLKEIAGSLVYKDVNKNLQIVLANLGGIIQVEKIGVFRFNEHKKAVERICLWQQTGIDDKLEELLDPPLHLMELFWENTYKYKRVFKSQDLFKYEEWTQYFYSRGIESIVTFPLYCEEKVYGWLSLVNFKDKSIENEEIFSKIEFSCSVIAAALNRMDFEERLKKNNQQLVFLSELYEQVNKTLDLEEILNQAILLIKNNFSFKASGIYVNQGEKLALQSLTSLGPGLKQEVYYHLEEDWVNNIAVYKRLDSVYSRLIIRESSYPKMIMTVPIFSKDNFIGVMVCTSDHLTYLEQLKEEEEDLFLNLGYILGSAMEKSFLYKKALEASQLKSLFVANMSHEIRTPLTAIIGFSELLTWEQLTARQSEFVTAIQVSSNHLLGLIDNILDLSKIEVGKMEIIPAEFFLDRLLDELQEMFRHSMRAKKIDFQISCLAGVGKKIFSDQGKIKQVLVNLLGNALKFTQKGKIELLVEELGEDRPFLRFTVKDSGIGIPTDKLQVIFDLFSQADSSTTKKYGGTGLGLAISKKIVKLLGGEISVNSTVGLGSEFYFTLPLSANLPEETENNSLSLNNNLPMEGDYEILLVEDNEMNEKVIRFMLQQEGYEKLDYAANGWNALEKIQNKKYDLVLMDLQMPEMDGYTTIKKVREMGYLDLRIIAFSAYSASENKAKALSLGCNDYLCKPIKREELVSVLERYLGKIKNDKKIDKNRFNQLRQEFLQGIRGKIEQLDQAFAKRDSDTIKVIGHNLKGSGTMFKYEEVSLLGAEIEEISYTLNRSKWELIRKSLLELLSSFSC